MERTMTPIKPGVEQHSRETQAEDAGPESLLPWLNAQTRCAHRHADRQKKRNLGKRERALQYVSHDPPKQIK
jgi:hypothetical protein